LARVLVQPLLDASIIAALARCGGLCGRLVFFVVFVVVNIAEGARGRIFGRLKGGGRNVGWRSRGAVGDCCSAGTRRWQRAWGARKLTGSGRSQAGWVVGRVVAGKGAVGVVVLVVPHDGGGEGRGRVETAVTVAATVAVGIVEGVGEVVV
jgi:hypothetical protein